MGAAFDRVLAALEAHGRNPLIYASGKLIARCPGPGHWRGDVHPSFVISPDTDKVLAYCHALCATEDVLAAIGLGVADLYDSPARKRPKYTDLWHAIGAAQGVTLAEKAPMLYLALKARGNDALIPKRFQPASLAALAEALRADTHNLRDTFDRWQHHGWLSRSCMLTDCQLTGTHPGRGHNPYYLLDIGGCCPGRCCPCRAPRKRGQAPPIKKRVPDPAKRGFFAPENAQLPAATPGEVVEGPRWAPSGMGW